MREREGKQRAEIFGTAVRKTHLHAVASEVDPERRLGKLWGYLLRGELHFPGPVGVAIQAQVLLVGIGLRVEILDVCVRESVGGGYAGRRRQRAAAGREGRVEKLFRGKEPRATGRAARAAAIPTRRRCQIPGPNRRFPASGERALRRLRRPTRRGRGCRPLTCGERLNQALAAVLEVVRDVFDRAWSLHCGRISKAAPRPDPTRETRARWRSMRGRRTSRGTGRATSVRVTFPARQTRLGTCAPRQCAVTSTRGFLERSDFAEKQKRNMFATSPGSLWRHFAKTSDRQARRVGLQTVPV